jgi:hypothetical protein
MKFIGALLAIAALTTPILAGPVPEPAENLLDQRAPVCYEPGVFPK